MKKILLLLFAVALSVATVFAQAPEKMNYQGVARDNSGNVLPNQSVGLQIKLRSGSPGGTVVYQETHATSTNAFGLFNVQIGGGTVQSGTFASIAWGSNSYYVEVLMDASGGTSYTSMGTQQLVSVPYALYAKTSGSGISGSGTTDYLPLWTSATGLGDSRLQQNTTTIYSNNYTGRVPAFGVYAGDATDDWAISGSNSGGSSGDGSGWDYFSHGGGGLLGLNENGGMYRSGVQGVLWTSSANNVAGVIGTAEANATWGALSYKDNAGNWSGVYGTTELTANAVNGYNSNSTAGTNWGIGNNYAGVHGEGAYSGDYQAGVYGYMIGSSNNSGGVVGAYSSGTWGGLGYVNSTGNIFGVYSSGKAYVGGVLQVVDGTQGAGKVFASDANGNGSWQNSVSFRATSSSTSAIGVDVPVVFGTQVYDNGGDNYNPATGVFTAPVAGVYHFDANIHGTTSLTNTLVLAFYNGSTVWGATSVPCVASAVSSIDASTDIALTAGQQIWVITEVGFSGTLTPDGNDFFTSFTGHLVR
jgi:hypothetical protein